VGAQKSRLAKAGGDYNAAVRGLLAENHPDVEKIKAQLGSGDPSAQAAGQAALDRKINQSTKGKYSGIVGTIGKGLGKLAPIAALAIPGLGPLAAAGIAAGGSAAGRALQGKSVNVGNTLLQGAGAYGARKVLGGGTDAADAASGAAPAVAGAGGKGVIGRLGDWVSNNPLEAAQLGLGAVNAIQGAKAQSEADRARRRALGAVNQPQREDLSGLYGDSGNPYAGPTGPNRARRAAVRSLSGGSY